MGQVGQVVDDDLWFYEHENEIATSTNSSTFTQTQNSTRSETESVGTTESLFDPCSEGISEHLCISYPQLAIICVACFTVLLMILLRVLYCCFNRRRKQKRVPDIMAMEGDMINHTKLNSVSVIGAVPPPRYSQIFDQDGISVFEEAPPEYETAQPDLLKTLPQNLSRTSSLANKEQLKSESSRQHVSSIEVT